MDTIIRLKGDYTFNIRKCNGCAFLSENNPICTLTNTCVGEYCYYDINYDSPNKAPINCPIVSVSHDLSGYVEEPIKWDET